MPNVTLQQSTQTGATRSPGTPAFEFPKGFLWGVSTSAFQVEGHPGEAASRCSDWSHWTVKNGRIADRSTADQACQFHVNYKKDLDLCQSLNMNAFRLDLNWA